MLLGDGNQWGLNFTYTEQVEPRGLADAFLVNPDFIGDDTVCLILGDNLFFGQGLASRLQSAARLEKGALIFAYPVRDPQRYGVVEFNGEGQALSIEEKPQKPRSKYAVPGLYFYDKQVVNYARALQPSARGELEITDLNRVYLERTELRVEVMSRGVAWLDAGTHESLLQAANFVQAVEERQGMMIACPEEIAFQLGYIDQNDLHNLAAVMQNNQYGEYLLQLVDEKNHLGLSM